MSVIDKGMYKNIKAWCDRNRPKNQYMMYVNSRDHALTRATIKKLMFDIHEEDDYGEEYIELYSAKNFYRNIREYYSYIADLYMNTPADDANIVDIIDSYPPTCGWITLIVEGLEELSCESEKMKELFESFLSFATKRANIIVIGNGDYNEVFEECEFALQEMNEGIAAKEEDGLLMIGCYDQEENPTREIVVYDDEKKRRDELDFYWRTMLEQLEKECFDYCDYKVIFKDTLEYLVPRVTKECVRRKDLRLIEKISSFSKVNVENVEGCEPWELDAAKESASGLYSALVNRNDNNDEFASGQITLSAIINDPVEDHGALHISGYLNTTITVDINTVEQKIDSLAEAIRIRTYEGKRGSIWHLLHCECDEEDLEVSMEEIEEANGAFNSLMDGIKEIADRTINREIYGERLRRYSGNQCDVNGAGIDEGKGKCELKILSREYDVPIEKIRGHEQLEADEIELIDDCKQICYIAVLGKDGYTINDDGNAEMTKDAQEDYDNFVAQIRQRVITDEIEIMDEGYGVGECELEWHITLVSADKTRLIEINTSIRTDNAEE